jgi:hypothetical protein
VSIKVYSPRKTWIQLSQSNNWLFSFDTEYNYNIVCNIQSYQVKLGNAGILSFKSKTFEVEIVSQPNVSISTEVNQSISLLSINDLQNLTDNSFTIEYGKIKDKGLLFFLARSGNKVYQLCKYHLLFVSIGVPELQVILFPEATKKGNLKRMCLHLQLNITLIMKN